MGPSVVDTVKDLRNIQRSLLDVSPLGSACSVTHGWLSSKSCQSVTNAEENLLCCFLTLRQEVFCLSLIVLCERVISIFIQIEFCFR